MASKLIKLQDGTLVEIDVPENEARLISRITQTGK